MCMKQNDKKTAFILAAGLGSRLKEFTHDKPKALVELNGKTLLEIVLDNLISHNFNHFVINVHHFADKIIDFLNQKNYENIEIEISDEREQLLDTGGAILKALPYFKESKAVLIHNVDILSDIDFNSLYDEFANSDDAVWLLTHYRNNKRKLLFDENDSYISRYNTDSNIYTEEILSEKSLKLFSYTGLQFIKPQYFERYELKKCYIFDIYDQMCKDNVDIKSKFTKTNYWFDLGTQEQIKEASSWLLSQK